ncbi:FAD-dependent oxidoreductase [Taylorella equigenitalis]|uniref:FAD-dependent oxidoreductase n=1 Tax=Taylorella equigenitalis TaxID=29575 RepID=UPI00041F0FF8|nr:FAD-dependent oxidoreductase [Taylorella equigenitalis]WDU53081.1 FAD-dependent oxidoreductase [Taylorella equigenitalis]
MFVNLPEFLKKILKIYQQKQGPTVVAIKSTSWEEVSGALIQEFKKVLNFNVSFEKSLHIILLSPTKNIFFKPSNSSHVLKNAWPLPMSGINRIDILNFKLVVHIVYDEYGWDSLQAEIDVFIVDEPCKNMMRLAVSNIYVYTPSQVSTLEEIASFKQFKIVHRNSELNLYQLSNPHIKHKCIQAQPSNIAVIGAGIAGASIANLLSKKGHKVDLFDPKFNDMPTGEVFETSAGAITPVITADDSPKSRISRAGVLRARTRWQCYFEQALNPCGTLEVDRDKGYAKSLAQAVEMLNFPDEWIRRVTAEEATSISGFSINRDAVFLPFGMQISPLKIIKLLTDLEGINKFTNRILSIDASCPKIRLKTEDNDFFEGYDYVVIASAIKTPEILATSGLDTVKLKSGQCVQRVSKFGTLHALSGQTLRVPAELVSGGPKCVIGGLGYFLPEMGGYCVMGSTYKHNDLNPEVSLEGHQSILSKIPIEFDFDAEDLVRLQGLKGHACVRAVVNGRTPLIGRLKDTNVFLACAYGSHGMTWASLGAEIIGAEIGLEPSPLSRDLLRIMAPDST